MLFSVCVFPLTSAPYFMSCRLTVHNWIQGLPNDILAGTLLRMAHPACAANHARDERRPRCTNPLASPASCGPPPALLAPGQARGWGKPQALVVLLQQLRPGRQRRPEEAHGRILHVGGPQHLQALCWQQRGGLGLGLGVGILNPYNPKTSMSRLMSYTKQ